MDMKQMMKQARKMQEQLAQIQDQMQDVEVDATAGGGMVKAVVSGTGELKSITIDKEAVDPEDVELLQDMIVAAVNEALRSANELSTQRMGSVTGNLNLPGLF
ncbi:MAG: YbaB/EbfC family nucleoid-associated protein [Coriobacteriia bacterium]|nr:YbaB/EbfC family nucleoid-associated protein [Coriobacteriia bacterium]